MSVTWAMKKAKTASIQKKKSSQVEEKTLTASSNHPSPTINPDLNIPDQDSCLLDQEACPDQYLPDKEEINKDLLHWVLAVNAVTRKQAICTESLPSQEAVDTVSIPYAEQLSLPYAEVTYKSDSVKKLSQLLRLVQVSTNLDTLKALKPELTTVLESFLSQFKGLDVHKVTKIISSSYRERHSCNYIELVVHQLRVRAILDSGAPGNIVSTRLVKKLKLAPDLDYNKEFGTAGPDRAKALGAYSSLLLRFGKLVVTAPAIALQNKIYDILIGTSFMATYRTIINHQDSAFSIFGHSVPMFYHGNGPKDLPTKKIPYINMEYTNGDMPVACTLRQCKIKILPLATKKYKGIPLYSASEFLLSSGSQVILSTGLCLSFLKGLHSEVAGLHNGSHLELWILPGIVMPLSEEILVLLSNLSDKALKVKKHQLLRHMGSEENSSLMDVTHFGEFNEFALPCNQLSILLLILCKSLNRLTEDQKCQALCLFEKCMDVFAKHNHDL
ncbi:DNA damage-inducible protein 1 [Entomophthora muscae]|uniref:DNA damage-inducible protein 1 n=1 Tax=Entomophthora muscae TaxID=34485 RepID=A0ACC2RZX0_9FUNG|nr:DNA damage-inducible protein 1 [Entomophthora muscae]